MRCSGCQAVVQQGAAICPRCHTDFREVLAPEQRGAAPATTEARPLTEPVTPRASAYPGTQAEGVGLPYGSDESATGPRGGLWGGFRRTPLAAQIGLWALAGLLLIGVVGAAAGSGGKAANVTTPAAHAQAPITTPADTAPATTAPPATAPRMTAPPATAPPATAPPATAPPATTPRATAPLATAGQTISQSNAHQKAESYLGISSFSRKGLIEQLVYEGFTQADATYGVDALNADWNEQAAKKAASYLSISSFSRSGLIDQLVYDGFTQAQAAYGVSTTGL